MKLVCPNREAASSSSMTVRAPKMHKPPSNVRTLGAPAGGIKRVASNQPSARSKRKLPPDPASAVAAINRMKEAREHPL